MSASPAGPNPYQRLRGLLGAHLRHRLFLWMFMAMAITSAVVAATTWTISRVTDREMGHGPEHFRTLLATQFAAVWSDSAERRGLAEGLSGPRQLKVVIRSTDGQVLESVGQECPRQMPPLPIVRRDGVGLGAVELCMPAGRQWRIAVGLLIGLLCMWGLAGALARLLSRPLEEVTRIAERIGTGEKFERASFSGHRAGWHRDTQLVADVLADMAERIEKQLRDQRELMAAVSHELRTPLGHLRLLIEGARVSAQRPSDAQGLAAADPQAMRLIEQCEREILDIDSLVGQLLANARLEFREIGQERLDVVDLMIRALERADLDPTLLDVEGEHLVVTGDATLLQRAVANLLDNARRHGGGATILRVRDRGDVVAIEVEDSGSGFAPGEAERAFQPFYGAGHRAENLGLGLHLVERIALAHKGRAWAGQGALGGAVVGIALPKSPPPTASANG